MTRAKPTNEIISLRELIARSPTSIGSLNFLTAPSIVIKNQNGVEARSYTDLAEFKVRDEEREFAAKYWAETLKEHPKFYDGNVTVIVDAFYDKGANEVSLIMDQAKYSLASAMKKESYPNKNRIKDLVSFGIGMMCNLEMNDGTFLMIERSQKVHFEKGAWSVPGGSLEYKAGEKDDVKAGLANAALEEVEEEVLPKKMLLGDAATVEEYRKLFDVGMTSIAWEKNSSGAVGLNSFFSVRSKGRLDKVDVLRGMREAKDGYESVGAIFVDAAGNHFKLKSDDVPEMLGDRFQVTPQAVIDSGKLEGSGKTAMSAAIYGEVKSFYERGVYSGSAPHPAALAEHFPSLTIFDAAMFFGGIARSPQAICDKPEAEKIVAEAEKKR